MDWRALHDPNNNPILIACLQGGSDERLKGLGIPDLRDRLARLERGNVIKRVQGRYALAFPAVIGDKREQLQRYVEQAALKLVPLGEQMITEIRPHLAGREEMMYHVLWSVILDGPAWGTARAEMLKQVHSGDTSSNNKGWVIYPPHPFDVGTNSSSGAGVSLRMTWSHGTPSPGAIEDVIRGHIKELMPAIEQKTVVASEEARTALGKYGLVDEEGNVRLYTLTSDSEASKLYTRLSEQFGREAMARVDMAKVSQMLDVPPGVTFLIAQHELCWQLLQDLAEKQVLAIPAVAAKPGTDIKEGYQLVSMTIRAKTASAPAVAQITKDEEQAIAEFGRIKQEILAGRRYEDTSTPLRSFLSVLSSVHSRDAEALKRICGLDEQQIGRKLTPKVMAGWERDYAQCEVTRAPLPPASQGTLAAVTVKRPGQTGPGTMTFIFWDEKWMWMGPEPSEQEIQAVEEYRKIKAEILAGRKYEDHSTPLRGLLSFLSAAHSRDAELLKGMYPVDIEKMGMKLTEDLMALCESNIAGVEVVRAPSPPEKPQEGTLQPIYVKSPGQTALDDTLELVFWNGRWVFLGNQGNPCRWRNDPSRFKTLLQKYGK